MFDFPDNPVLNDEVVGTDGIVYVWDGVKWISGSAPMVYLPIAGGTMTGALILHANPTVDMGAATKKYVDDELDGLTAATIDLSPSVGTWTTVQGAITALNSGLQLATRGLTYVGSYDAAADVVTFVNAVGIPSGPLPAPNATGLHPGDYIIVTTAKTTTPVLNVGDQLITDGTAWNRLAVGHAMATITADIVPLSPVVGTWNTVQDAIEDIHTDIGTLNTNAVLTTGSYADPTWITSLAWSKITGHPTFVDTAGSYNNPSWLVTLDWSKITNVPAMPAAVTVSDTAPATPSSGQLWFDAISTQLFVWYVDPTSSQWVVVINESGILRDAPDDGKLYGRQGRAWVEIV